MAVQNTAGKKQFCYDEVFDIVPFDLISVFNDLSLPPLWEHPLLGACFHAVGIMLWE